MPNIAYASEAEWLALRDMNVGGSEVAALFYQWRTLEADLVVPITAEPPDGSHMLGCLSPYTTGYRLWHQKAGIVMPDFAENERVDAGTFLEPAMAAWAMKKWPDFKLRKVRRYMTHPIITGWGSSLDYETVTGLEPVEFKNVDRAIFARDWAADGETIIAPPLHINLQLQAQLGVAERERGHIVVCVGGNELKRCAVELHPPSQVLLAATIAKFWRSVREKTPPARFADASTVAEVFANGERDKHVDLTDNRAAGVLARRFARLKRHLDFVETIESNIKGRLLALMGEYTKATTDTHGVTWPVINRKAGVISYTVEAKTYRGGVTLRDLTKVKAKKSKAA